MKRLNKIFVFLLTLVLTATMFSMPTQAASLSAPKVTSVYASRNSIFVSWPKNTNCTGYEVQYSVNSNYSKAKTAKFSSSTTTGEIKNLKFSKKYYIRVRKYKGKSKSGWTKTSCYTRNKNEARKTYIKSISPTQGGFKVTWNAITKANGYLPATGYQLRYSTDSTFKKGVKTVNVSGKYSSKTITGLSNSKKYYVQIRTYRTVKKKNYYSVWCGKKSVTPWHKYAPNPASSLKVDATQGAIIVYPKFSNASGCNIQYSTDKTFKSNVTSKYVTKVNGYLYGGLGVKPKTVYVRIRTYNVKNKTKYYSPYSSIVSAKTLEVKKPSAPQTTMSVKDAHSISVNIKQACTNATHYIVEYSKNADFSNSKKNKFTGLSYTITGLSDNTTYFLRTYAENSKNSNTVKSDIVFMHKLSTPIDYTPGVPSITSGSIKYDKDIVTLSINQANKATDYTIQFSEDINFSEELTETRTLTNEELNNITFSNLIYDKVYYFRAKSHNNSDEEHQASSEWSAVTKLVAPNPDRPSAPVITLKSSAVGSITVSWGAVDKATSYTIQYGQNKNFSGAETISNITSTSYKIKDLYDGEVYYVRVKAENGDLSSAYTTSSISTMARKINEGVTKTPVYIDWVEGSSTRAIMGYATNKPCLYSEYQMKQYLGDTAETQKKFNKYYYTLKRVYKETGCKEGMDDVTKFILITEWMYANVDYDDTVKNILAYDAIINGKTVCMGYAALFVDLCYLANIPAYYVTSDLNTGWSHGYAAFKLGGYWYLGNTTNMTGLPKLQNYGDPFSPIFQKNLNQNSGVGGFYRINGNSHYWNAMAEGFRNMITKQCKPVGTTSTNKELDTAFLKACQYAATHPMNGRVKSECDRLKEQGYKINYVKGYNYK